MGKTPKKSRRRRTNSAKNEANKDAAKHDGKHQNAKFESKLDVKHEGGDFKVEHLSNAVKSIDINAK